MAFRFDKKLIAVLVIFWLATLACNALQTTRIGDLRTDTRKVETDSAASVKVQIEIGVGELGVQSGANSLMDATFRYNVDEWKPKVDYHESGVQGELSVTQQGKKLPVGNQLINEWDIQLSNDIPLDLVIHTGAGNSDLSLSNLSLNGLEIETGAGVTDIDLTGSWEHDLNVSIQGGLGEITVRLPSETGVRVQMNTALVSVRASGLEKDGSAYINQAYGMTQNTITLEIDAGVGSVILEVP
jgi:hypothetical protein